MAIVVACDSTMGFPAESNLMRVLVATDAWHPQVNGVVRTLNSLARAAAKLGVTIEFLSPDGFPSFPVPTYPGLRLALPSRRRIAERIEAARPTPSISRPKGRSALPCAPIAAATAGRSPRATRRGFPNISPPARRSRKLDLRGAALVSCGRGGDDGGDAVADERSLPSAALPISACGRAASTSICSAPIAPSISAFRGRFS